MEISKKSRLFAIIAIALLTLSVATPLLTVNAHDPPWFWTSYAYIAASPNPVGLGQRVYFMFWLVMPNPSAAGNTGDRWNPIWLNVTKPDGSIVKMGPFALPGPGLTGQIFTQTDQLGTYKVDLYFPGQTVKNPGYTGINSTAGSTFLALVNDTWGPASASASFTVQTEPLQWMPAVPLPVSYWTRPIDINNFQNWYALSGPWLGANLQGATYWKYNAYGYSPESAHVNWAKPITWGGVVGGGNSKNNYAGGWKSPSGGDQMTFYSGTQYQLRGSNPIIMYQNLYLQLPADASQRNTGGGFTAISLVTGETLWTRTDLTGYPQFGQFYDFDSVNQHGTTGVYIWFSGTVFGSRLVNPVNNQVGNLSKAYNPGFFSSQGYGSSVVNAPFNASGWIAIDPMTGNNDFNETNIPGAFGTISAYGPQGEWLRYGFSGGNSTVGYTTLWQWNNTQLPGNEVTGGITGWTPYGNNYNMSASYDFNVTLSTPLKPGPLNIFANQGNISFAPQIVRVVPGDLIFGQSSNLQLLGTTEAYFGTPPQYELWAINLNATRGPVGQVLWDKLYDSAGGNSTYMIGPQDPTVRVFTMYIRETQRFYGYSLDTGNFLWGPTESQDAFNYFTGVTALTWPSAVAKGILYNAGQSGIIYAYNLTTGKTVFTYGNNASDPFNSTRTIETAYGGYPTQIAAVSYNTLYAFAEEHSLDAPPYRGASIRAIDSTTGKELWKMYGMAPYQSGAVGDGYLVYYNLNDGREYAVGPGPSAMTVNAPGSGNVVGSPIEITGTVTDKSPNNALTGTAAIADKDQGPWMEYLVQNTRAKPFVNGVPVSLTITDSNGTAVTQTTVTSDSSGIFGYAWTPTTAGEYRIYASFDGSQSYGSSSAEAATVVGNAPSPLVVTAPPAATPTPITPATSPSPAVPPASSGAIAQIYVVAAAVIVIVIVVVAALVIYRRRK